MSGPEGCLFGQLLASDDVPAFMDRVIAGEGLQCIVCTASGCRANAADVMGYKPGIEKLVPDSCAVKVDPITETPSDSAEESAGLQDEIPIADMRDLIQQALPGVQGADPEELLNLLCPDDQDYSGD